MSPTEVVVMPSPSMDFEFDTTQSLPYATSPRRFGEDYSFSSPTSPTGISRSYHDLDDSVASARDSSLVPFENEDDFAFDFRVGLEESLPAEELFDRGVIRPLKFPPCLLPPRSPGSAALSPKQSRRQSDVGIDPLKNMWKESRAGSGGEVLRERGRERVMSSSSGRRTSRSHSPLRVSGCPWEEAHRRQQDTAAVKQKSSSSSSKKWSIKDLLLFRSASEGSATDKNHPFGKYSGIFRRQEEIKNSSFRSDGSYSGSMSRRRGRVSAHELHYTTNKAALDDLRKKTFLPYKQGILGRMAFNPAVHTLANGFGSVYWHQG